jgi:hypothetical protein
VWFDSAAEARYAALLELQRKAGKIEWWDRGPSYTVLDGPTRATRVTYKPDFIVKLEDGSISAVDVKSKATITREFRIKALLWARKFPDIPLRVVDVDGNIIWPKVKMVAA